MFNFGKLPESKLETKRGKFIRPGVQSLILNNLHLESSKNTGNQRPVFTMETEPITDEGWEGFEGAAGQIGKVAGNYGYYLKTDEQKAEFAVFLKAVMQAVGTYDSFMEKHAGTDFDSGNLQSVVDAVLPFIKGTVARYLVCGEQYQKLDNTGVGLRLKFPTRRGVESAEAEPSKLPKFDETNPSHFKKLTKNEEKVDDLPF